MTDNNAFERFVAGCLADDGSGTAQAERVAALIDERMGQQRQWPRWLALLKEPPMRSNSHIAVGSPTARFAAIAVATILTITMLAGAGIAGARLLAAEGAIIVAQDGSGTVETITQAVSMADDGDTIRIRPGTYVEAVTIDKDLTIEGGGPRHEIILMAPEGGPSHDVRFRWGGRNTPFALLLREADATISDLTLRGERARLIADGGSPLLEDLTFDEVSTPFRGTFVAGAIVIHGGAEATVRESEFSGGGPLHVFESSHVLIEANELRDGPNISGEFGDDSVIRDNTISGLGVHGITFLGPTGALIESNTISDRNSGITPGMGISVGSDLVPVIRDNTITGTDTAIVVRATTLPELTGNLLVDNDAGIRVSSSDARITDNELDGNDVGISAVGGSPTLAGNTVTGGSLGVLLRLGTPTVVDNVIEGVSDRGLVISDSDPVLSGNRVCGNGTNVVIEGTEPDLAGNEICPN
jgi:parallel beta-helix repeat protein